MRRAHADATESGEDVDTFRARLKTIISTEMGVAGMPDVLVDALVRLFEGELDVAEVVTMGLKGLGTAT